MKPVLAVRKGNRIQNAPPAARSPSPSDPVTPSSGQTDRAFLAALAVLGGAYVALIVALLEALCGLKPVRAGRIILLDRDVTRLSPAQRGVGYVPQDLALFPTLTVHDHLAFALLVRRWPAADVAGLAELLGVRHLLDRYPPGLSGGESQRVALGRALSFHPRILLLDEPLSALDEDTRAEMVGLLRAVQRHTGGTTLHVTHRLTEARKLADRLLLLRDGAVCELTDAPPGANA
jgi:ABC-type sugar transport system ATPase subunit